MTSPLNGATLHYNEVVTVAYNSGAFAFGNAVGEVASLQYVMNGLPKATKTMIPAAAPATHSTSFALPAAGATATLQIHARNANGLVLETVTATVNLIAWPVATCQGATGATETDLTFNATLAGIPTGGSARVRYGTTQGVYPTTLVLAPYANGASSATATGLSAGTVYYYVVEILDAGGAVVATSPECSGQTLSAALPGATCPAPPNVDQCPPKQVWSAGGIEYQAFQLCDMASNTPVLAVFQLCDGVVTAVTYYDLTGAVYVPVGVIGVCSTGLDYETLCDKGTDPNTRMLAVWDSSTTPPTLKYYIPAADGSLTDYTPVGQVAACPETDVEESQICYLAAVDGTGYVAGDQLLQIMFWDTGEQPPTLTATIWRNQTQGTVLTTAPTIGDLGPCSTPTILAPQPFCFNATVTAPQDFPGRSFSGTLSIARGFTVNSVVVSGTTFPLGITWSVLDLDGTRFAAALQTAIQNRIPNSVVTLTPVGVDSCAVIPQSFAITIGCIKQEKAPVSVDLIFDGGSDLIQNAGFQESPPVPVGAGIRMAKRQDAGGNIQCTNVANRGWETNDPLGEFEIWPPGFLGITATPRGTQIQEINANAVDTLWQTMVVPADGNYTLRATVGGRGATQAIVVRLSSGDTNAGGTGDKINATVNATKVTGGTGAPWTNFTQTAFLTAGIYTLSIKGPPTGGGVGGLFTDLRLYTTNAGRILSLTSDNTCIITEDVTTHTTDCQLWQPLLDANNSIVSWFNPKTAVTLTNAGFWSQVPAPSCCTSSSGEAGEVTAPNLLEWYNVCGIVGGVSTPLIRQLILDQSGGAISEEFISADGIQVTPESWIPGTCTSSPTIEVICRCDDTDGDGVGETSYREIISISEIGIVMSLATLTRDLSAEYTPVAPVDCSVPGDNLIATQPNYTVKTGVGTWSIAADAVAPVTSVTLMVIAVGNVATPPTVTTNAGAHPLYQGQSITWSIIHQRDVAGLRAPLVLTTRAGDTVAVAWTTEVI